MHRQPLILITNDDGIQAKGIAALVAAMQPLGRLVVVAPDAAQSGKGHGITIHQPLRLNPSRQFEGIETHTCSGTPVDCVKMALDEVLQQRPDIVVSGINHGSNAATNVLYSGTMAAAVEGAVEGIPSIGYSLLDYAEDADFEAAAFYAARIAQSVLKKGLPEGTCLNVNIPKGPVAALNGVRVCRQGRAHWEDTFDKRKDTFGKDYYWLTGNLTTTDERQDTDLWALERNYVSVVPTQFDLTAHALISSLNDWTF